MMRTREWRVSDMGEPRACCDPSSTSRGGGFEGSDLQIASCSTWSRPDDAAVGDLQRRNIYRPMKFPCRVPFFCPASKGSPSTSVREATLSRRSTGMQTVLSYSRSRAPGRPQEDRDDEQAHFILLRNCETLLRTCRTLGNDWIYQGASPCQAINSIRSTGRSSPSFRPTGE